MSPSPACRAEATSLEDGQIYPIGASLNTRLCNGRYFDRRQGDFVSDANKNGPHPVSLAPTAMRLSNLIQPPDLLNRNLELALLHQLHEPGQILSKVLVLANVVKPRRLVAPHGSIPKQHLGDARDRRSIFALVITEIRQVCSIPNQPSRLTVAQNRVRPVEAFKPEGIKDGMGTAQVLHLLDPPLVFIRERHSAHLLEVPVVSLRRRAVYCRSPQLRQGHDGLAHGAAEAVHKDALLLGHPGRVEDHGVRGRPVEDQGAGDLRVDAGQDGNQLALRDVDQLGLGAVHCQRGDPVAGPELGARGAVGLDAADEAVSRRERCRGLLGVPAQTHVDVCSGEAAVDDANLDFVWQRGWHGFRDNVDVGDVAKGRYDDLFGCWLRTIRHSLLTLRLPFLKRFVTSDIRLAVGGF